MSKKEEITRIELNIMELTIALQRAKKLLSIVKQLKNMNDFYKVLYIDEFKNKQIDIIRLKRVTKSSYMVVEIHATKDPSINKRNYLNSAHFPEDIIKITLWNKQDAPLLCNHTWISQKLKKHSFGV
jgi:hypothetical protein